ncbi:calcium-binding protein [Enterovirga sp. GCM10030262]|uniref:calcium-binding protein n=1 Tax=Enterovirga sp. GCM10030262 TaxID=3273391 RepID=UPI0036141827
MAELFEFNISTDDRVSQDFGTGLDRIRVSAEAPTSQVRLVFTSSEVGNGDPNDSGTMSGQDGGLAVRMVAEDGAGVATGQTSRFDDEGIRFESATAGLTFDIRDLVSGVARGDQFQVAVLGTSNSDTFDESGDARNYYINGGEGNDDLTGGDGADFLVGGLGSDRLKGGVGNDGFIGGSGNDVIFGGSGNDNVAFNLATDGRDQVNLSTGDDDVVIGSFDNTSQIRLTFTSSEVGNRDTRDSGALTNQDGGFAVRVQGENLAGATTGNESRFDDEGVTFRSSNDATFDVRDLVSGTERGDLFNVVTLGTDGADLIDETGESDAYYINGGMGNDDITGGRGVDFLVGGGGDDRLVGADGGDNFIGGGGDDTIFGQTGADTVNINASTDGSDRTHLGSDYDVVNVSAAAAGQIRLTFTSAEVGNGDALDSDGMANQDGDLAVRMQSEGALDILAGDISRFDDEGVTFVSTTTGVTFDVRDLVSGTERGDDFSVVTLGSNGNDRFNQIRAEDNYYLNGGAGNDVMIGGSGDDFLVGGAGNDRLTGKLGEDMYIGGGGEDIFVFNGAASDDIVLDFTSGTDRIDLSAYGIGFDDVEATTSGGDTILEVDANQDGAFDFRVTLENSDAPVQTDYIFV